MKNSSQELGWVSISVSKGMSIDFFKSVHVRVFGEHDIHRQQNDIVYYFVSNPYIRLDVVKYFTETPTIQPYTFTEPGMP